MQKVFRLSPVKGRQLLNQLLPLAIKSEQKPYHQLLRLIDCTIAIYDTGSIVIQGASIPKSLLELMDSNNSTYYGIGVDESGKGDIFGGLVVAAVFIEKEPDTGMMSDVTDSKKLADARIRSLATLIQKTYPHIIIELTPEEYNTTYSQYNNINHLLAELHRKAACGLIATTKSQTVICDQFAHSSDLLRAKFPPEVILHQFHQAESRSLPVAAASILARDRFIRQIDHLAQEWKISIPKGATFGRATITKIVKVCGFPSLNKLSKLHFKPIQALLNES